MNLSREKKGELIIISEAVIWSFFPIIIISVYQYISPLFTLALGNFFAVIFFFFILCFKQKWSDFKHKKGLINVALASVFLCSFWIVVFIGLQYTTAGNASIVLLMEILFSFVFFGVWQKEQFTPAHIGGAIIMTIGAIFILFPGKIEVNIGDLILLIGTMIPPIGNMYQQRARQQISTETLLFVRNLLGLPIVILIAFLLKQTSPSIIDIQNALPLLILNGIVMFGICKIMWIEGIHRITVSKAVTLNTISPVFTLIFAYYILQEIPTFWQFLGFLPILIGGFLITKK